MSDDDHSREIEIMAYQVGRPGEGENSGSFVLSGTMERVSWGAIFAGAVSALAVQVLLALLGIGLGLAAIDVSDGEGVGSGALIYWLVAGIASLFAGGFVAGRMAGVPLPPSAVLHGAVVWGIVTVLSAAMAISGATAFVSGASRMAVQFTDTAAQIGGRMSNMVPNDMLPDGMNGILPNDITAEFRSALNERNLTVADIRREAREMAMAVVDEGQREQAAEIARETGRRMVNEPSEIGAALSRGIDRLIGSNGVIGPEDRQELVNQMTQRFDITASEAEQVADRWSQAVMQAGDRAEQAYENLTEETAAFADEAADQASSAAFWAAIVTFLGLVAACVGAMLGRPEDLLEVELAERREAAAS